MTKFLMDLNLMCSARSKISRLMLTAACAAKQSLLLSGRPKAQSITYEVT